MHLLALAVIGPVDCFLRDAQKSQRQIRFYVDDFVSVCSSDDDAEPQQRGGDVVSDAAGGTRSLVELLRRAGLPVSRSKGKLLSADPAAGTRLAARLRRRGNAWLPGSGNPLGRGPACPPGRR